MRTTRNGAQAVAHPAPGAIQEHRRQSASASSSIAGHVRWDWEGKSLKFTKLTSKKPEKTISLQRAYEILQSTPSKKQRDDRKDLSSAVVSVRLQRESPNPCCCQSIPQFSYLLLV
jgi:hypothetical protein